MTSEERMQSTLAMRVAAGFATAALAVALPHAHVAVAQPTSTPGNPVALVDSNGNVAARPLGETVVLVAVGSRVVAPAAISPIYDAEGRAGSGLATWRSGGSVLFTSADCTMGAHVYSSAHAGLRAAAQVRTQAGIVLYVGEVGPTTTTAVQSILYDTGCAPVAVRQNGLVPVVTSVNLTTTYPPPLSFQ
jgi:hypothetical protein